MSANMALKALLTLAFLAAGLLALNEQCGRQAGNKTCPGCFCCSSWGFCGTTEPYCVDGCQSKCGCGKGGGVAAVVTKDLFDKMLLHRNNQACPAKGFYTYEAFITAADAFPEFGTTGDLETRKREVAAFLGQTAHETTGGWDGAPDGPYAWGYCYKERPGPSNCLPSEKWPCVPGKYYFGRGPFLMSYNTNYGPVGEGIRVDLLNNPELVSTDPIISFKTALWIWMTEQSPKPSCHAVITGQWTPTTADIKAGRVPGYGVITNIINGQVECGNGPDERGKNRIGFYKEFCDKLKISYGPNLDCYDQSPFGQSMGWLAQ